MSRDKGTLGLSANLEPQVAAPLDARRKVALKADLLLTATWTANDGGVYAHDGMYTVVFGDTPVNNGMWILSGTDYTDIGNWEHLGAGETVDHNDILNRDAADAHPFSSISLDQVKILGDPGLVITLLKFMDYSWSAGLFIGIDLTVNVDGTVSTSAGAGVLRNAADPMASLYLVEVPATANIVLADKSENYLYVSYNAQNPIVKVTTDPNDFNCLDECIIFRVSRDGTRVHYQDLKGNNIDTGRSLRRKFFDTEGMVPGIITKIEETGERYLKISAGSFWNILTTIPTPDFDSSGTDRFEIAYKDAVGDWVITADQAQLDNLNFNENGSGLTGIGQQKYANRFIFYILDQDNPIVLIVFGREEYLSGAAAENEQLPRNPDGTYDLPADIKGMGLLVGIATIKKDEAVIDRLNGLSERGYRRWMNPAHDLMLGVAGHGPEYNHLNNAELIEATQYATNAQPGLSTAAHVIQQEANTDDITTLFGGIDHGETHVGTDPLPFAAPGFLARSAAGAGGASELSVAEAATLLGVDPLLDNSIADPLHRHSELVAPDGSPDPAVSVDATGNVELNPATASSNNALKILNGGKISLDDGAEIRFGTSAVAFFEGFSGGSGFLRFGVSNEKGRVNSAGNWGFGTGATISARVHAKGSTSDNTAYVTKADDSAGGKLLHVRCDGQVELKNFTFPIPDGAAGQTIEADGAGNSSWATPLTAYAETVAATETVFMGSEDFFGFVDIDTSSWLKISFGSLLAEIVANIPVIEYPSFYVHRNGVDQIVTSGVETLINWTTKDTGYTDSDLDLDANRFKPTVEGIYTFSLKSYCAGATLGEAFIRKNGTNVSTGGSNGPYAETNISSLYMNGITDYVEGSAKNTGGTTIFGAKGYTNFSGSYVNKYTVV